MAKGSSYQSEKFSHLFPLISNSSQKTWFGKPLDYLFVLHTYTYTYTVSTVCGRQAHAHGRHKFLDLVLAHVGRVIPASVKTRRSISLYEFESKPTTSRMWTSGNSKTRRTATSEIARISPRFAPAKAMVLSAAMDESHTNDYTTLSVSEFDLKIYISLSLSLYIYIYIQITNIG